MTLCGFGLFLAALLTVRVWDGRDGLLKWLHRRLTWRRNSGWYALAFLSPPLAMLAELGLHVLLGGALPASPAANHNYKHIHGRHCILERRHRGSAARSTCQYRKATRGWNLRLSNPGDKVINGLEAYVGLGIRMTDV